MDFYKIIRSYSFFYLGLVEIKKDIRGNYDEGLEGYGGKDKVASLSRWHPQPCFSDDCPTPPCDDRSKKELSAPSSAGAKRRGLPEASSVLFFSAKVG